VDDGRAAITIDLARFDGSMLLHCQSFGLLVLQLPKYRGSSQLHHGHGLPIGFLAAVDVCFEVNERAAASHLLKALALQTLSIRTTVPSQ